MKNIYAAMAASDDYILNLDLEEICSDISVNNNQNEHSVNEGNIEGSTDSADEDVFTDCIENGNLNEIMDNTQPETRACNEDTDMPDNSKTGSKHLVGGGGQWKGKDWKKNKNKNCANKFQNKNKSFSNNGNDNKKKDTNNNDKNTVKNDITNDSNANKGNSNNNRNNKSVISTPPHINNCSNYLYNNNNYSYNNESNSNKNIIDDKSFGFKTDVLKTLNSLFHSVLQTEKSQPLDSFVLYLHYRIACILFMALYIAVANKWYFTNQIVCISGSNADTIPKSYLLNICLSYSFLKLPVSEVEETRYILFYRWVPYAVVLNSVAFYLPRIFMKRSGGSRVKRFIADLSLGSTCGDIRDYETVREKVIRYFKDHAGSHRSVYVSFLLCHLMAFVVTLLSFIFLDFVLQGNFWKLPLTLPLHRDPFNFSDLLSRIFPPFVTCEIGSPTNMVNERIETFYCHLTLMELYEKIFLIMWLLLVVLLGFGVLSVIVLCLLPMSVASLKFLLHTAETSRAILQAKCVLISKLNIGDIFILYLVKRHVADTDFAEILLNLSQGIDIWPTIGTKLDNINEESKVDRSQYILNLVGEEIETSPKVSSYYTFGNETLPQNKIKVNADDTLHRQSKRRKPGQKRLYPL